MRYLLFFLALTLVACATDQTRRFQTTEIVWEDPDRQPIPEPEEYWSGLYWDGADQMVFRPISHVWLLEVAGPALNTNALDEVPNSSWYTNRMALRSFSPADVVRGPCADTDYIDTEADWIVKAGKVDGANPGFTVEDTSSGQRYLLKFDDTIQQERATAADVIGSKVYWGAGFSVPCNQIIFFDVNRLKIGEGAKKKNKLGQKTPIVQSDIAAAIQHAPVRQDGRIRASASLFLSGKPLGPLQYNDTRSDDPNDLIPHEDRRELRGSKVLAAWLNHFDAREQNTFTTFVPHDEIEGYGYVQHHILDWGDCFGSEWESDLMSRRFGHSWYFHAPHVAADFLSLGMIQRPWDFATRYPDDGPIFGYFDVANFDPGDWHNGYGHPAFARTDEVDGWWGAKIVSRFSDAHIKALVEMAEFADPRNTRYLERTLIGRRDKIVRHFFEMISPFDMPQTRGTELCVDDLGVHGGYYAAEDSFYEIRIQGASNWKAPSRTDGARVCIDVADVDTDYIVVEARVRRTHQSDSARATKIHLHTVSGAVRVAGIERY